jgi:hypothetical protein
MFLFPLFWLFETLEDQQKIMHPAATGEHIFWNSYETDDKPIYDHTSPHAF